MSMISALVFLSISVFSSALDIDLELKLQNDPQCKFQGQQCSSDLKSIIYCTAKNGNSYVVTSCMGSRRCKKDANGEYACLKDLPDFPDTPDTVRNDTVFTCVGEGTYPDGYRCSVGYMCSKPGNFPDLICECPPDSSMILYPKFACTTNKNILDSCKCPYTDRCKEDLSGGGFGENCHPGYFYVCKGDGRGSFVPEVHKCPEGEVFVDGKCVRPPGVLSVEIAGENNKPVCRTYYPPCTQESNVRCSKRGELIAHTIERCYYFCSGDLKPIVRDCGPGSIFTCKNGQCGCILERKH